MTAVGIIDYGMGNLLSVYHAVEAVGGRPVLCDAPDALGSVDRVILPGVGAFKDCIANLRAGAGRRRCGRRSSRTAGRCWASVSACRPWRNGATRVGAARGSAGSRPGS